MQDELITTVLTGHLPFVLIASAVLALPLSWILLWRYRKAVSRIMMERAGLSGTPKPVPAKFASESFGDRTRSNKSRLNLQFVDTEQWECVADKRIWRESVTIARRVAWIYLLAGFVFALIIASAYLLAGIGNVVMMQLIVMCGVFFWPGLLVFNQVTTTTLRGASFSIAGYLAIFLIMNGIVVVRNPHMGFVDLLIVWATYNLPPTLLLLTFLGRRIRAVGPMVWMFMFAAITGSLIALSSVGASDVVLRFLTRLGNAVSLEATGIFLGILLVGFAVFSLLGWVVLKLVRTAYRSRLVSDQSLTIDTIILIFAMYYAINLAFDGIIWVFTGIVAFVCYSLLIRAAIKHVVLQSNKTKPLLVLRVFSLGKKSEDLFQAITQRWRYLGHVQLIAGPDLATATIEPHEFLTFLSGRLKQEFIHSDETLQQRLAMLETQQDFDGRFRINELFCYADTWKQALAALVNNQNTVLMDLRSFTTRKPGCIHELNALVQVVPLNRIILVVDHTTDLDFLSQILSAAWQHYHAKVDTADIESGNGSHTIKVCRLATAADPVKAVMPWLCAASN